MLWDETPTYDQVQDALRNGLLPETYAFGEKYVVREKRTGLYDNAMYIVDPSSHTVTLTDLVEMLVSGDMGKCTQINPSEVRL